MKKIRASFPSGELSLEGILSVPQRAGPFPAVIVCHPHPLYGGSMDNNVVRSLCEALAQASLASFRFNFRGAGGSQGEFDHGRGEREDVKAAISFTTAVEGVDSKRIGLAGYSAGAGFALPVGCDDERTKALAAISPPFSMFNFDFLKECLKPKLLITGGEDEFVPTDRFLEFCRSLPEPKECACIEGVDHFWRGHESRLTTRVAAFFVAVLEFQA